MIADIALHCPKASDGKDQPHAHIMLTLRPLKPDGSGFGNKERAWNDHALLEQWREAWATAVNQVLADAESSERIDHRTLKAQGIDRAPLPHMPHPFAAGRLEQIADHLTERLNQWQAARFRKFALEIIDTINNVELIPWGISAAWQEESLFEKGTSYGFKRG